MVGSRVPCSDARKYTLALRRTPSLRTSALRSTMGSAASCAAAPLRGDTLLRFVCYLLQGLFFLFDALALVVALHDAIHVGFDAAVGAVGFDGVEVVPDEGGFQHGFLFRKELVLAGAGVCVIAPQGE